MPLSPTGAELLFEVFSQRYERGSSLFTSNLPFDEWTSVFGSERLTGAPLDRLTHQSTFSKRTAQRAWRPSGQFVLRFRDWQLFDGTVVATAIGRNRRDCPEAEF